MLHKYPLANTPTTKLMLGLGLCAIGGGMLYVYFKTRDDEDDNDAIDNGVDDNQFTKLKCLLPNGTASSTTKSCSIKLKIKNEHVPILLGRDGVNLRSIEEKTQTKIFFREKDNSQVLCTITGYPDNCKNARSLLLKEIERSPIVTEEIYVPQSVTGKIIGRCGEAMQEICRISMAKVSLDSTNVCSGNTRRILISGNRQQVNVACKLIEDKIEEDKCLRQTVNEIEQKREPRRSPVTINMNSSMCSSENSLNLSVTPREKLIIGNGTATTTTTVATANATKEDNCMEVYVCAVATPSKFWVQIIGPQTKKLDDLVNTMTDYYSVAANRDVHAIKEPYLGQIVATIFKHDSKWYRAEIVGILPNQYNPQEVVLDLYFVDYGDSEYMSPSDIFELRTDFLTLRFQAVECFLAKVKSTLINHPETWEAQSVEAFEELTKVARWKKLISRLVTYKDRVKNCAGDMATHEDSPIPGVELYDIQDGIEVNLGNLLVSNGFALPINDDDVNSSNVQRSNETIAMQSSQKKQQPQEDKSDIEAINTNEQNSNAKGNTILDEQLLQDLQKDNNEIHVSDRIVRSVEPDLGAQMKVTSTQFLKGNGHQKVNGANHTSTQWQLNNNPSR